MLRTVLLLGGTALLALLIWRLGASDILDAFGRIGWYLVPIILLGAGHHALRALALQTCVGRP